MFAQSLRRTAITAMLVSSALQAGLASVAEAVQIQIKQSIKMRELLDSQMERVGLLKAGSIVEIPDEFVIKRNGRPDLELTLNNWLRKAGKATPQSPQPGLFEFDGEKHDFFFPIRVVSPAAGSTLSLRADDGTPYIALSHLARRGNAMIVSADAPLARKPKAKEAVQPKIKDDTKTADPQVEMEASSPCAAGACSNPTDKTDPVKNLVVHLGKALTVAEKRSQQVFSRTSNDLDHLEQNVRSSCGFPANELTSLIKSRAEASGVPAEILLALMTQESSGKCFVLNSETDRTQSVGLFQINSDSAKFPRCTAEQKRQLRAVGSAYKLSQAPRCLENPIVNLDEAIRIIKINKTYLTQNPPKTFDEKQLSEADLWRLVASGYNGGSGWVLKAKTDLERFNAANGTSLNPHSWEDLRLFYLRRWLSRKDEKQFFGTTTAGRSKSNAISNLAYAENLFGRPAGPSDRKTLAQLWTEKLQDSN
ncbi:MAG: transglycosylase SLT domain-containing protein [Bdellovibrionales bacterium]|nr:transglycosylase SLT domain-containing protein [Bdellovibrionales bacterium]